MSTIRNATITDVSLGNGERGLLTAWLTLDYGGTVQSFGGYALYLPKGFKHYGIMSTAGHFIYRCMQVAGVSAWEEIPGKTVRVRIENGMAKAIGHITKDDWFDPSADFAEVSK